MELSTYIGLNLPMVLEKSLAGHDLKLSASTQQMAVWIPAVALEKILAKYDLELFASMQQMSVSRLSMVLERNLAMHR